MDNIKEKLQLLIIQYGNGGFTQLELIDEIKIIINKIKDQEILSVMGWVSSIGEQFFDPSKSINDLMDSYKSKK